MNPYYLIQKFHPSGWGNFYDDHYTLEQALVNIKSIRKQYKSQSFRIMEVLDGIQKVFNETSRSNQ